MEIILKEDIKGVGYKNDIVNVKPGYARNFLIPQGVAMIATPGNKKMITENIRQAAHKADKLLKDAQAIADSIANVKIELATKAGESGKIFGAVTAIQVAESLRSKGFDIDRKKIIITEPIKMVGEHKVTILLHKEVQPQLTINVVAE